MKLPFLIFIFFISCADKTNSTKNEKQDFYPTYTKNLDDSTQTLDFEYIAWSCECANWATPDDINKYRDTGKLSDHSVFIEPANTKLELPDTLGYSGDIIRFTGQFYKEKGYPKKYLKSEEHPDRASVFRYSKYVVVRSDYRNFIKDTSGKTQ